MHAHAHVRTPPHPTAARAPAAHSPAAAPTRPRRRRVSGSRPTQCQQPAISKRPEPAKHETKSARDALESPPAARGLRTPRRARVPPRHPPRPRGPRAALPYTRPRPVMRSKAAQRKINKHNKTGTRRENDDEPPASHPRRAALSTHASKQAECTPDAPAAAPRSSTPPTPVHPCQNSLPLPRTHSRPRTHLHPPRPSSRPSQSFAPPARARTAASALRDAAAAARRRGRGT